MLNGSKEFSLLYEKNTTKWNYEEYDTIHYRYK